MSFDLEKLMSKEIKIDSPHVHLKFKLAVSGAAETGHCAPDALEKTKALGREIVAHNAVLVTGATTGEIGRAHV